jgi:hypothetical protein
VGLKIEQEHQKSGGVQQASATHRAQSIRVNAVQYDRAAPGPANNEPAAQDGSGFRGYSHGLSVKIRRRRTDDRSAGADKAKPTTSTAAPTPEAAIKSEAAAIHRIDLAQCESFLHCRKTQDFTTTRALLLIFFLAR